MATVLRAIIFSMLLAIVVTACNGNEFTDAPAEQLDQEPSYIAAQVTLDGEQLDEFADFIEQARLDSEIPGVAAAIVQGEEIILAEGFGVRDVDGDEPITPETLFHIGSTHKSITAMWIASLVDDGLLDWDTPVVEIFPDFELSDPESTRVVTMRHLLSMSSGIPDEAEDDFDVESGSAEDLLIFLSETPLLAPPGEEFSYSNISASAAGYIGVLAAGGDPDRLYEGYAQSLQERIFDPIGMLTATLSVEEAQANPNHSSSHIFDDDGDVISVESYDFTGDPLAPSGSIKASVLDMAEYMSTQVMRGLAPNGTRVVSAENLTETWQPQIEDDESDEAYGMGWGMQTVDGVDLIWHDGSYDNFSATLIIVPAANAGMALLTNLDDPSDFLEIVSEEFVQLLSE